MNNESNTNDEEYRRVLASANKLDAIQSNLDLVIDFFLAPIVKLYSKLCNDCLKLLFETAFKFDYFRTAEELVWRRIYHSVYRFQKTKRQPLRYNDKCLLESHFVSGIGYYSGLIIRLRAEFKVHGVDAVITPLNLPLGTIDDLFDAQVLNDQDDVSGMSLDESSGDAHTNAAQQWARQAIYRSLVYMGDLARYSLEFSQFDYRRLAFMFYQSAFRFQSDYGLPFNQLATLAGANNHNLDAVCNYMRCCLKVRSFDGAEGNMLKIFELNDKFFATVDHREQIKTIPEVLASKDPLLESEIMMRAAIVTFIKVASSSWRAVNSEPNKELMTLVVEEVDLFLAILREAIELESVNYLDTSYTSQIFQPVSCGSSSLDKPRYVSSTIMYEFCCISLSLITKYNLVESESRYSSEYKEIILSLNELAINMLKYATYRTEQVIISKVQELRVIQNGQRKSIFAFVYNHTYLPTIKVLFDWLLSDVAIIESDLHTFRDYCTDLYKLVSLLRTFGREAFKHESEVYEHMFIGSEWTQKYPLSCDYPLIGLKPLQSAHELNIDFSCNKALSESESGFVTVQCIEAFAHALNAFLENKNPA